MFMALFIRECKQTAKSLIYWLIVGITALFFFTQLGDLNVAVKPQPGMQEYGYTYSKDKDFVMKHVLGSLAEEYYRGSYITYPIGFYKSVKLNEKNTKRVGDILRQTTGLTTTAQIEKKMKEFHDGKEVITESMGIPPSEGLTYGTFKELMLEVDDILGGGSSYSEESLDFVPVPETYEGALKDYNALIEKDRFTGGYARLFSDYMGIMLAFLPVFLAVTRGLRDRRASMQELIGSRKASSAMIIGSRYLSMIVMLFIPVLLLSCVPLSECVSYATSEGISFDPFAFVKYSAGWLLPTMMTAAAVGMICTELTDTAIGVLVQGAWWYLSVFTGVNTMQGGMYGFHLVPRHNTSGNYEAFQKGFAQLAANRIMYVVLSVILVGITMWIYTLKRKGKLDIHGKIFTNRKRKSKA